MSTPRASSPPITPDQIQAWVDRRRRARGRLLIIAAVVLAVVVFAVAATWAVMHGHLAATGRLESNGYRVEWTLNLANLDRGGETAVSFSPHRYGVFYSIQNNRLPARELPTLAKLRHLKSLDLTELPGLADDDLAAISGLGELNELILTRPTEKVFALESPPLDDAALEHLAGLGQLRVLVLAENRITDAGVAAIAKLSNLEDLDLDGTKITDAAFRSLAKLRKLKTLRIERTGVTQIGVAEFQQSRPGVEVTMFKPEYPTKPTDAE